jgi:hypothetical protein
MAGTMKASLTTKVPSPKLQGGHSSSDAVTQKTKIQSKSGATKPGASNILYSKQPSGTKGVGSTAGKPMSSK